MSRDKFACWVLVAIATITVLILAWGIPHVEKMRAECEAVGGTLKWAKGHGHWCER